MQNRYRRSLLAVTVLMGAALGFTVQALAQFTPQRPKLVDILPAGGSEQGYSVALSANGDTTIAGDPCDAFCEEVGQGASSRFRHAVRVPTEPTTPCVKNLTNVPLLQGPIIITE